MHGIIKANLPLPTNICHAPFCGFTAGIYKVNLKLIVEKQKAHKEKKVVLHIALIEPRWVHTESETQLLWSEH